MSLTYQWIPGAWRAALRASYILDIGSMVDGVILDKWGLYRRLDTLLEEGLEVQ